MTTVIKSFLLIITLSIIASCSSKKDDSLEPKGLSYKTSEITVRQCSDIGNQEFITLLENHDVMVKKQMSPHLYIVTWDDDRSADAVVHELTKTTMFCGVDKYQE